MATHGVEDDQEALEQEQKNGEVVHVGYVEGWGAGEHAQSQDPGVMRCYSTKTEECAQIFLCGVAHHLQLQFWFDVYQRQVVDVERGVVCGSPTADDIAKDAPTTSTHPFNLTLSKRFPF